MFQGPKGYIAKICEVQQYNKMAVLHFFLVNSTLIYILFSLFMNQGVNLMNLRYVAEQLTASSIWTTNWKFKTKERSKSVIQVWTGSKQFKFIKFSPRIAL